MSARENVGGGGKIKGQVVSSVMVLPYHENQHIGGEGLSPHHHHRNLMTSSSDKTGKSIVYRYGEAAPENFVGRRWHRHANADNDGGLMRHVAALAIR